MNLFIGERVFVYRNLHKKCYSVRSMKTGKVLFHVDHITLSNVKFRVGKAGRERVLRTKQKNVHAGVVGYIADVSLLCQTTKVTYNPYKYDSFVRQDESSIKEAKIALIDASGILAVE
jgi:hypothetical protein